MRKASVLLLVLAAACGDDGHRSNGDAPPGSDGGRGDGSYSDAASPYVTVTVSQGGAPRAGVQIYFQNADSTTAGSAITDATGAAQQIMAAGGYVTAIDPFVDDAPAGQADHLFTIAGVQPGDHLVFSTASSGGPAPAEVDFTLTIPYAPTAYDYTLYTACGTYEFPHDDGSTSPPTQYVSLFGCPAAVDALITANTVDGELVGSFWSMQQPIASGASIDLSAHTYETAVPSTITALTANDVDIERTAFTSQGLIYSADASAYSDGTQAYATLVGPMLDGAIRQTQVRYDVPYTNMDVVTWGPTSSDETIDVAHQAVAPFASEPHLDVGGDTLAWTSGDGVSPDLVIATYTSTRGSRTWDWWIAAAGATSVTYPTLPAAGAEWNPTANDVITVGDVGAIAVPGGWEAARATIFGDFFAVLGTTGSGTAASAFYTSNIADRVRSRDAKALLSGDRARGGVRRRR